MILHDLLRDTAEELESLEDTEEAKREAVTMHHNPTLENMYQRLEQMEVGLFCQVHGRNLFEFKMAIILLSVHLYM